jgi:hypothetical protein
MYILYILSTIYTVDETNNIGPSCAVQRETFLEAEFMDEIQTKEFSSYSQSPIQLCLEISISSNSRNLLQFLQFSKGERKKTL